MYEKKTDITISKTVTALYKSLYTCLKCRNFRKITTEALCAEALISRATFYSHFNDKYDLLTKWLIMLISKNISRCDSYEKIEETVNQFISENKRVLKNIVDDTDSDTLRELYQVARFILNFSTIKGASEEKNAKDAVLDSFFIGGFIYYMSLQLCDNGLSGIEPMNIHLYTIIKIFQRGVSNE